MDKTGMDITAVCTKKRGTEEKHNLVAERICHLFYLLMYVPGYRMYLVKDYVIYLTPRNVGEGESNPKSQPTVVL